VAFVQVTKPGSTGFFVFPVDEESPGARIPHDYTRVYPLTPFERATDPRTFASLKTRVGSGPLTVVGLWPDEAVVKKWELIVGGETCFFVNRAGLAAAGTIIHSDRSRQLAEQLFGKGSPGTHELLILLAGLTRMALPLDAFFAAIGRKVRAPFKGFTTVSPEQLAKIDEKYGSVYAFLEAAKAKAQASP
jgi:hypothetical protein